MPMQAQVHTNSYGDITVHMKGDIDYENNITFRKELEKLIIDNPKSSVVLDLNSLEFVGSSGIGLFVETLNIFSKKSYPLKLANVKPEFQKIFRLYKLEGLIEGFESDETANINQDFGNRKFTFQN